MMSDEPKPFPQTIHGPQREHKDKSEPQVGGLAYGSDSHADDPNKHTEAQPTESDVREAKSSRELEMNGKEYREFLAAVEKRHVRIAHPFYGLDGVLSLKWQIERLTSQARLIHALEGRHEETAWYPPLRNALGNRLLVPVEWVADIMHQAGITAALDEHGEIIFSSLSREFIPNEDIALLQSAGLYDAEAEVTIIIHHLRQTARSRGILASTVLSEAPARLNDAIETLPMVVSDAGTKETEKKPRKYFTGIGRILSGAIAGAGNLMIGIGTIPASGGATAGAVIASSALAVGLMSQGIGDLRGE